MHLDGLQGDQQAKVLPPKTRFRHCLSLGFAHSSGFAAAQDPWNATELLLPGEQCAEWVISDPGPKSIRRFPVYVGQ